MTQALLVMAIPSDEDLLSSFAAYQPTCPQDVQMEALKLHMITDASLYDSKANLVQSGISSRLDVKSNQHLQEALERLDDPDLISNIEELLVNRTQRGGGLDYSAHAPDNVWHSLSNSAKTHWRTMDSEAPSLSPAPVLAQVL